MKRQRYEEDFWNDYKGINVASSPDKFCPNEYSSEEEELMLGVGRGDNIQERLGKDNERVWLEPEEQNFRPIWEKDAGEYLWRMQEFGLSATDKRKR